MVCVCGHPKREHETGRDYGRNGWRCRHREEVAPNTFQHCKKSCMEYTKKTKEADGQ